MILGKKNIKEGQISIKNTLLKFSIRILFLKNKNRYKLLLKTQNWLNKKDNFSSKNYKTITQKQIKIYKFTHKLHSLHPFI